MGDAIGGELVKFRCGQTGQVIGDSASDGRGQGKAVPGAEGKRQPWKSRGAADEREVIQAVGLEASPGAGTLELAQRREHLAGESPVSLLARLSQDVGAAI